MGPKMITYTFYDSGSIFPIAQDICYTGLSGRIILLFGRLDKVLSVNAPITH